MITNDTIVAISSATGPAARMIVRMSGAGARTLLACLDVPSSDGAGVRRVTLNFSDLACPARIYEFVSPRSYTGEDLVELHVPGNPLLARMLLEWLVGHGARQADPGEFTARAYFHGKLDLSQAEGIAATIAAQSDLQLSAARKLMAGELASRLRPIMESLGESLALVEAGIDFSEERMEFLSADQARNRINSAVQMLQDLISQSRNFEELTHEPTIVFAGRPNAGKSTLTNALAGTNRSIVSPQPGTTRDALSIEISLPRGTARLIDVAGIETTEGEIGRQMKQLAERAIEQADVLVLVRDCMDSRPEIQLPREPHMRVLSKIDLRENYSLANSIAVSAKTARGMGDLANALDRLVFGEDSAGASLALASRHIQAINQAISALMRAPAVLDSPELIATDLRQALDWLGRVLGAVSPDDILGRIFSTFCIGK